MCTGRCLIAGVACARLPYTENPVSWAGPACTWGAYVLSPCLRTGCDHAAWSGGGSRSYDLGTGRRCLAPLVGGVRWSGPSRCWAIKHHTHTQHAVWSSPKSRSARLHRMRVAGNTLETPCCRTRRHRRAKHRLRELEAVPLRQAVLIVAPSTRAPQASATALPPPLILDGNSLRSSVATSNRITDAEHSKYFGTSKQGDCACSNNCLAFEMSVVLCGEVWDSIDAKDRFC